MELFQIKNHLDTTFVHVHCATMSPRFVSNAWQLSPAEQPPRTSFGPRMQAPTAQYSTPAWLRLKLLPLAPCSLHTSNLQVACTDRQQQWTAALEMRLAQLVGERRSREAAAEAIVAAQQRELDR